MHPPVVLCILDGVGWAPPGPGNAVSLAKMPTWDRWVDSVPWTLLRAHGAAVGMPSDGDMGNSEVGHNAMGAGRVFDQGAKLVERAIATGRIWESAAWQQAVKGRTLHLVGLLSDGNVHSHVDHLFAMVRRAAAEGVRRLRVHVLTDGRDVQARSALTWLEPLEELLAGMDGDFAMGSGGGRMRVTMDRYEAEWDMVERGWALHVAGRGRRFASACEAVRTLYDEDPATDDQWLPGFVVGDYDGMHDGDAVVLFNFRGDRAIELSRAFDESDFAPFQRDPRPDVFYAGMMEYDGDLKIPRNYLVEPPAIDQTVPELMSRAGLQSLATAETQKFGHVTYFFNGNDSSTWPGETWEEVKSLTGPFDRVPQMKAVEVTQLACRAIRSGRFHTIRLNLANGDMVGHTGSIQATVKAMGVIDECLAALEQATAEVGGLLLVTADHGNAEQMYESKPGPDGQPRTQTSHSLNPVPFFVVGPEWTVARPGALDGTIAQIGSSLLHAAGLELPEAYMGSLLLRPE